MIDSLLGKNASSQPYMRSGFVAAPEQIASNASGTAGSIGLRQLANLSSPKQTTPVRQILANQLSASKTKQMELGTQSMPMSPL